MRPTRKTCIKSEWPSGRSIGTTAGGADGSSSQNKSTDRPTLKVTFQSSGVRMDYSVSGLGMTDDPVRKNK